MATRCCARSSRRRSAGTGPRTRSTCRRTPAGTTPRSSAGSSSRAWSSPLRHAVATLNAGRGYATSIIGSFLGHSDAQQGELVKTTYADARAQLTVVKAAIKPVPARIVSPLEFVKRKEQERGDDPHNE